MRVVVDADQATEAVMLLVAEYCGDLTTVDTSRLTIDIREWFARQPRPIDPDDQEGGRNR